MSPRPDTPEFTAAALGEDASPDFAAAVAADPAMRGEAEEIRAAGAKLRAALRSGPALTLSDAGRRAVLQPRQPVGSKTRPPRRPVLLRRLWPVTAAAAGIAALLGGLALVTGGGRDSRSDAAAAAGSLPTIGIQRDTGGESGASPGLRAPLSRDRGPAVAPPNSWVSSPERPPEAVDARPPGRILLPIPAPVTPPAAPAPVPPDRSFASPAR